MPKAGKNGDFDYQYNGQISVDEDNQIMVGHHLSLNANDKKEVEPAIEKILEATGRLSAKPARSTPRIKNR